MDGAGSLQLTLPLCEAVDKGRDKRDNAEWPHGTRAAVVIISRRTANPSGGAAVAATVCTRDFSSTSCFCSQHLRSCGTFCCYSVAHRHPWADSWWLTVVGVPILYIRTCIRLIQPPPVQNAPSHKEPLFCSVSPSRCQRGPPDPHITAVQIPTSTVRCDAQ